MIRIILWRAMFEFVNLCKIFFPGWGEVYYFAYGANLSPTCLDSRKVFPRNFREFELKGYALSFSHPGPFEGMGFASIEERDGESVQGLVFSINKLDLYRLCFYELVPFLSRYRLEVFEQDGTKIYSFVSNCPRAGLKPSMRYLNLIVEGLERMGSVDKSKIHSLKNLDVVGEAIPAKNLGFVYKTHEVLPDWINSIIKAADRSALKIFLRYFKNRSLFEGYIHA